jgi:CheY-like chemotaxis protein
LCAITEKKININGGGQECPSYTILYLEPRCGRSTIEPVDRILVIDDDVELCSLVGEYLAPEGFQVESAADGTRGLEQALNGEFLLVVLDVMLPGLNGFEVLRRLRDKSKIPVLLLTARGEDVDRIVGLEIGADDYLPKPFNPRTGGAHPSHSTADTGFGKVRERTALRNPARG